MSSVSSDSDDECSYTNSVSVLKNLTRKKIQLTEDSDIEVKNDLDDKADEAVINVETVETVETPKTSNDSCIVLSDNDDDLDSTPVNIISTIDSVLKKGKKGRKAKGVATKRITRSAAKQNKASESKINFVKTYVIEDDCKPEDVNYEVPVKVWWKSQYFEKFTLRRFEKFQTVFKYFAELENIPESRLLFTIRDKIVTNQDTPDSLDITAATIIEGGILSKTVSLQSSKEQTDRIEVKVQMKDRKKPMVFSLKSTDQMEVLLIQCAEELKVAPKDIKLYFDGDIINFKDTPQSLQFEGGECVDCFKN